MNYRVESGIFRVVFWENTQPCELLMRRKFIACVTFRQLNWIKLSILFPYRHILRIKVSGKNPIMFDLVRDVFANLRKIRQTVDL